MNAVVMAWFSNILLVDKLSSSITSHNIEVVDTWGMVFQTNFLTSFGPWMSERNFHQGSIILPQAGFVRCRWPNVEIVGVRGNNSFHSFRSLGLNQPMVWVGWALISSIITRGISIMTLSTLITLIISKVATELELAIRVGLDLRDVERPLGFSGIAFFWNDSIIWWSVIRPSTSKVFFALNWVVVGFCFDKPMLNWSTVSKLACP